MNYPKKEDYNIFKKISKKERNTISLLPEFLDFRYKKNEINSIKYSLFFIPILKYYNIVDLEKYGLTYLYTRFCSFISYNREHILTLKQTLDIKDFYTYRYQWNGSCEDDFAGVLFKNKEQKLIFLLKHADIIDTILK